MNNSKNYMEKLTFKMIKQQYFFLILVIFCANILFSGDATLWNGKSKIQAKGNSLSLFNKADEILLSGNTEISRDDFLIKAETSNISQKNKYIKSTGNVFAKRLFENSNYLEAYSDKIFYNDKDKVFEIFDAKDINYFLQKENKLISMQVDYLYMEEANSKRLMKGSKIKNFKMPFDEKKEDGTISKGFYFANADNLISNGDMSSDTFDYWELTNNVFMEKQTLDNDSVSIKSGFFSYDKKKNKVAKFNDVKEAVYFVGKDNVKYFLYADNIVWNITDNNTDSATIYGHPIIINKEDNSYIIKANKAYYSQKDGFVFFSDNPIAFQDDVNGKGVYNADEIYYYFNDSVLKFDKNVRIEFTPREKVK